METKLDIDPLFETDERNVVTRFEAHVDVEEDDEKYQVTLLGRAAVNKAGERFICFDPIAPPETAIGQLQRQYAKQNGLFIVDEKKLDRVGTEINKSGQTS